MATLKTGGEHVGSGALKGQCIVRVERKGSHLCVECGQRECAEKEPRILVNNSIKVLVKTTPGISCSKHIITSR